MSTSTQPAGKPEPLADKTPAKPFFQRRPVRVLVGALTLVAVAGTAWWLHARRFEETDDAFIEADVSAVAARVAGQVVAVKVMDNRHVNAGDVLVEIDPGDLRAAADRAKAAYEEAVTNAALTRANADATLAKARADLETARAAVGTAGSQLDGARADLDGGKANEAQKVADEKRYLSALDRSVSASQIDSAKAGAEVARALRVSLELRVKSFEAQLAQSRSRLGAAEAELTAAETAPAQIAAAEARVRLAKAAAEAADLPLSYAVVRAPVSGRVTSRAVNVGQFVGVGRTLLAIVPDDFYITANFKETQLARMRPGQPVEIRVDAFPDLKLQGRVDGIQSGTGARFSLLPPENATGNFVKVVQRVPVKITFDQTDESRRLLGPGLSVVPEVRVVGGGSETK